jgi:hypothetical protein
MGEERREEGGGGKCMISGGQDLNTNGDSGSCCFEVELHEVRRFRTTATVAKMRDSTLEAIG